MDDFNNDVVIIYECNIYHPSAAGWSHELDWLNVLLLNDLNELF